MACPGSVRLSAAAPLSEGSSTNIYAQEGTAAHALAEMCLTSVRLSAAAPLSEGSSTNIYAQEGTAAHALAEMCLTSVRLTEEQREPSDFIGMSLNGVEVTEEMAAYVKVFVDHCRQIIKGCWHDEWWVERQFTLAALNPPDPMFGTADFVAYDRFLHTLHVVDLKYGQGVVVEVEGNKQLRYYGLGAILSLDQSYPISKVVLTIVQPRVSHPDGTVRSEELAYMDILEFSGELLDAARETQNPNAELNPGSHCRFCPASGICPAQRTRALEIAQTEFEVIEVEEFVPPAPSMIPDDQFFSMLGKLHVLDEWMRAMRARAMEKLERGEDVPGFKLVQRRANRKWTDEVAVEEILTSQGVPVEEFTERSLKSPAKIEKAVGGKKKFEALLGGVVEKKSSGYTMVPDFDPRPALSLGAGHEFAALPAGEPSNTEGNEEESYRK
jgi:hypothetical protein